MNEVPLFITDPYDGKTKAVGTKQVRDDGTLVWFRRLRPEHVMRIGKFGLDASTYDAHFRGQHGRIRIERGAQVWEVSFEDFEKNATLADYGRGKQYMLAFPYWLIGNPAGTSPLRPGATPAPPPPEPEVTKPVWGETVLCHRCKGKGKWEKRTCDMCGGSGLVKA